MNQTEIIASEHSQKVPGGHGARGHSRYSRLGGVTGPGATHGATWWGGFAITCTGTQMCGPPGTLTAEMI